MYLMSTFLLPMWLIRKTNTPHISLAIGQMMMCKRDAFEKVGGYRSIRSEVCEDVQFVRLLKNSGYQVQFLDASNVVECNMYNGYWQAFYGIAKTYFSALDRNPIMFAYAGLLITVGIFPVLNLTEQILMGQKLSIGYLLSSILFLISWAFANSSRGHGAYVALFYPLMLCSLIINSFYSIYAQFFGQGFSWKDRHVK